MKRKRSSYVLLKKRIIHHDIYVTWEFESDSSQRAIRKKKDMYEVTTSVR